MTTIRNYQPADRAQIMELLRLNTPEFFSPNEEEDLVYYLDNHIEHYYVAELDGKVVGSGGINLADDGVTAKLSWDIVHPEQQGKGIGRALTEFRIQHIKAMPGLQTISVRTSQLVYPFYQKFGLEIKEIVEDFWEEGFDMYRMESDVKTTPD
ncbi:GNAT family N-acetyltransferase [Runella slithyformis]|uniref:GCN5-related N-acetyltransferase n=1 Tax=Runella slithyformis (strain ATCC 29530 / DSM 19594 / LMG 11500 / NCIMB 11436 / LSU 4) TaxID=761193 RepID=A0A7U3ZLL9_RUNSL|nr:GNAT family N-acetyltransferase [Runella slithyformis]AEI49474.1 GCN5-related N-acetyltransferase [Runella slithyformis DSM 19594]